MQRSQGLRTMLQKTSKNSSGTARDCHEEQNGIFCEEIRNFVNDSRKCQTVYANFEGFHERIVKCNDLTGLDRLIFLTLSDGKGRDSLTPDEFAETEKLTKFIARKIYNSRMKFKCNDIRFQVVWIYYFDYSEKEMKAMPVFKVYKRSWGPEALYIDITVVEYESWDDFIMHSEFPASFICVPRRGEYTFRGIDGADLLDLEYVCKNSQLRNKFPRTIRPFSQTLLQGMLHKGMPYVRIVRPFLSTAITIAECTGFVEHPLVGPIVGFISVVGIILRVMELKGEGKKSEKALESTAEDSRLMLLNDNGEKSSPWINCINLMYDLVERPLRDRSWIDVANWRGNLGEYLTEILKFVPVLIEVCKPFVSKVSGVEGAVLKVFLEFISVLSSKATEKKTIEKNGSEESENWLSNLEKYSSKKVFSELAEPSTLSTGKEISKPPLDIEGAQEYGVDLFGFRVYLLLKHTRLDCRSFLQRLLKSNYTLQEGTFFQDVTVNGNLIGVVIPFSFQSQDHAIVALHLEKLSEITNKKRDSLLFDDSHYERNFSFSFK